MFKLKKELNVKIFLGTPGSGKTTAAENEHYEDYNKSELVDDFVDYYTLDEILEGSYKRLERHNRDTASKLLVSTLIRDVKELNKMVNAIDKKFKSWNLSYEFVVFEPHRRNAIVNCWTRSFDEGSAPFYTLKHMLENFEFSEDFKVDTENKCTITRRETYVPSEMKIMSAFSDMSLNGTELRGEFWFTNMSSRDIYEDEWSEPVSQDPVEFNSLLPYLKSITTSLSDEQFAHINDNCVELTEDFNGDWYDSSETHQWVLHLDKTIEYLREQGVLKEQDIIKLSSEKFNRRYGKSIEF